MVGQLVMRLPVLQFKKTALLASFFLVLIENLSCLYTKGGSTLLKSRNGGRSLNIPIRRYKPFALIPEIRQFFDGPLLLSGSIATGGAIAASLAMGADMAYIGTRFIATAEANADDGYKNEIVESSGEDIVYSSLFTGVHGNYLRGSIEKAGLDPDNLPEADKSSMNFGSGGNTDAKAWKDIWGAGQGVGSVHASPPVGEVIAELKLEFDKACQILSEKIS